MQLFALLQIPETHRAVPAAGKRSATIRGHGHAHHRRAVPGESTNLPAAGEIPEPNRRVFASGDGAAAVRRQRDTANPSLVVKRKGLAHASGATLAVHGRMRQVCGLLLCVHRWFNPKAAV